MAGIFASVNTKPPRLSGNQSDIPNMVLNPPPGLSAIYQACRNIYPEQQNPLQVTAVKKYWLGGPDPLDYVSMYHNKGNPERNIPEHWHYITFGFSDLHGDGRVHPVGNHESPSGFGFELTLRLKKEPGEAGPPTWPAELLQALARYVFQSENVLYSGDHVSWHRPLDNSESRLQHMLMTDDPQLSMINTPIGFVSFIQVVGVCVEELKAAQQWNGPGVIELLKLLPTAGGPWLVTNMRRGETMFDLNPSLQERVNKGIQTSGSNLSGVSAKCSWKNSSISQLYQQQNDGYHQPPTLSQEVSNQIRNALIQGLGQSKNQLHQNDFESSKQDPQDGGVDFIQTKVFDAVHLEFNLEAGSLLSLACRGRVLHGRHFTFKSVQGDTAITLVATGVEGAFVNERHPYASRGSWLQVLITDELAEKIINKMEEINNLKTIQQAKVFCWLEDKLEISILPDLVFDDVMSSMSFV